MPDIFVVLGTAISTRPRINVSQRRPAPYSVHYGQPNGYKSNNDDRERRSRYSQSDNEDNGREDDLSCREETIANPAYAFRKRRQLRWWGQDLEDTI